MITKIYKNNYFNEDFKLSVNQNPSKVQKAYKLFRVDKNKKGKIFPLFVDYNTPVPFGVWIDADTIPPDESGKIKSKLGQLAYRPGWHSGDYPVATHIGNKKYGKKPTHRNPDYVWAEILVPDNVDWQSVANSRAKQKRGGGIILSTAHITDKIPSDGFYRYKTNPNMTGNWLISGEMKVLRLLSDEKVLEINSKNEIHDLPRLEPFDLEEYGFDKNGLPL